MQCFAKTHVVGKDPSIPQRGRKVLLITIDLVGIAGFSAKPLISTQPSDKDGSDC